MPISIRFSALPCTFCSLVLLVFLPLPILSQTTITVPYIAEILVDGENDPMTLAAALEVQISGAHGSATAYLAHDGEGLFCAFAGALQSQFQFPEVLFDPNGERRTGWQGADTWVHVSATDCSSMSEHSNYDNCALEQEDWIGLPNMGQSSSVNYIEIYLPFEFMRIELHDEFGLALDVTNTAGSYSYWPESANIDVPETWSIAQLEAVATDINADAGLTATGPPGVRAWFADDATLHYELSGFEPGELEIQVLDMRGLTLKTQRIQHAGAEPQSGRLELSRLPGNLAAGAYILRVRRQADLPVTQMLMYVP